MERSAYDEPAPSVRTLERKTGAHEGLMAFSEVMRRWGDDCAVVDHDRPGVAHGLPHVVLANELGRRCHGIFGSAWGGRWHRGEVRCGWGGSRC